jgi:prepilin-type N-terminal cleavage/methylation domain-containing protein
MRQSGSRRRLRGFSLIEWLVVIAILLIVLANAACETGHYHADAREMAVVREIQTINTAQAQYKSQFGKFAASLTELGPPASGRVGPSAADLIPGTLASGEKDGYDFTLTATPSGYSLNVNPRLYNRTGRRTFYSDQNMIIRQNWSAEPANASSPELR